MAITWGDLAESDLTWQDVADNFPTWKDLANIQREDFEIIKAKCLSTAKALTNNPAIINNQIIVNNPIIINNIEEATFVISKDTKPEKILAVASGLITVASFLQPQITSENFDILNQVLQSLYLILQTLLQLLMQGLV